MGRKRKAVGCIVGSRPKNRKVRKVLPEEEEGILAIKLSATNAIKEQYVDKVLPWITKISIESTKICELASLLFLNKIRDENEKAKQTDDWSFFDEGNLIQLFSE